MLERLCRELCIRKHKHLLSVCFRQFHARSHPAKGAARNAVIVKQVLPSCASSGQPLSQTWSQQTRGIGSKAPLPDHHPEKGTLVYVGTISGQVKLVKMFSLSTSIIGVSLQPVLYSKAAASTLPTALKFVLGGFFNFFIFMTPVLLHFLSKRYVTSMYLNSDTGRFSATTYNFFVREVETSFTRDEVDTASQGMLTTMKVGKKSFFFDPEMFLDKEAYIRMMRYDEPLDISFKPGQYGGPVDAKKDDL